MMKAVCDLCLRTTLDQVSSVGVDVYLNPYEGPMEHVFGDSFEDVCLTCREKLRKAVAEAVQRFVNESKVAAVADLAVRDNEGVHGNDKR